MQEPKPAALVAPVIDEMLSYRSVEHRVLRACRTVRVLPDREGRFLYGSTGMHIWDESIADWDSYGSDEVRLQFIPSLFDLSDYLIALRWCGELKLREFRLIWWRSFDDVSFATIGARIGRSAEEAQRRYDLAMTKVWHAALADPSKPAEPAWGSWRRARARARRAA